MRLSSSALSQRFAIKYARREAVSPRKGFLLKKIVLVLLFVVALFSGSPQPLSGQTCNSLSLGPLGAFNGFIPSPQDAWHTDITGAAVDPSSSTIINIPNNLGLSHLHPDFSSVVGGNYGIPYAVVDSSTTASVPVKMLIYPDDSDITLYPLAANQAIEGSPGQCPIDGNDRHAIVIDRNQCVAYELYQAASCNGTWTASNGNIWDLTKSVSRPYGMTSADAAGLSIFEGLVRYDEIVAGTISHAIRFTAMHTKNNANNGYFAFPATHAAGSLWGTDNIIGMRLRLRADFDISSFSQTNQVILNAMKHYGMILADNGSNLYFQGTPDARWNDEDLSKLKVVPVSAFEVVKMGPVYDSETAPTGAAPVISSFTASPTTVAAGGSVTLTPVVVGSTYSFIDKVGFVRGPVTVNPTADTTYTLTSRNAFGSSTASVTVKVTAASAPILGPIPVIKSIALIRLPSLPTLATFSAVATMSNRTQQIITYTAVWNSSNPAVATVVGGIVTFHQTGSASISAQSGGVTSPSVTVSLGR